MLLSLVFSPTPLSFFPRLDLQNLPLTPRSAPHKLRQITFGGRQPLLSYVVRWFIKRRIQARAKASAALNVEIEARSNREAMMGRFDTICVDFQELIFDDMQVRNEERSWRILINVVQYIITSLV